MKNNIIFVKDRLKFSNFSLFCEISFNFINKCCDKSNFLEKHLQGALTP